LQASARDGQVFLTWNEAETPDRSTFNVYLSDRPITDVAQAQCLAHHIERHSARDWWEDPASFKKGATPGTPVGFVIQNRGRPLDPAGGLFVHTVSKGSPGKLFFAVTCTDAHGREERMLTPGVNALAEGVAVTPGPIRPIWQLPSRQPAAGAGKGKSLWLALHAKGGVYTNNEYLMFGDESMGWREGLPFKFRVSVQGDVVVIRPTDRVWINRPLLEAGDSGTPAVWTFWYGYNSKIYDRQHMREGLPSNYTERRNLWILHWVRDYYQPDAKRCFCSGSSMGGCGTVSFGLRHPELFAGLHAHVPIVSYTYLGTGSARRLEPLCWIGPIPPGLKTREGVPLLDSMNGTKFVLETKEDLPMLYLINGRQDASIPWQNNPPFFRALNDTHQAFAVYWDNGTHPTCGQDAPPDVKDWARRFQRFRLNESLPAFSNTSSNRDPGDGHLDNGDLIGWMNRGMDWKQIEDTADHYAITISADYPGVAYPVQTDLALRRVQQFKTRPGEQLSVRIGAAEPLRMTADARGRITIPRIAIPSPAGVRIMIHRAARPGRTD
jgi:hypothetical protein